MFRIASSKVNLEYHKALVIMSVWARLTQNYTLSYTSLQPQASLFRIMSCGNNPNKEETEEENEGANISEDMRKRRNGRERARGNDCEKGVKKEKVQNSTEQIEELKKEKEQKLNRRQVEQPRWAGILLDFEQHSGNVMPNCHGRATSGTQSRTRV